MRYERDYIERTIATVRNHREADNCWPQWANIFADEIEACWAELAAAREEGDEWREATRIGAERLIQAREEAEYWKRLAYHYQSLLGERGLL